MSKKPDGVKTVGANRRHREHNLGEDYTPKMGRRGHYTRLGRLEIKRAIELVRTIDVRAKLRAAYRRATIERRSAF